MGGRANGLYPSQSKGLSAYSSYALIGLSAIGIFNGFYLEVPLVEKLFVVVLPYAAALFFSVAMLLGRVWARLPIVLISVIGVLLNFSETIEHPNQKDAFEIVLFLLIIGLLVWDRGRILRNRR